LGTLILSSGQNQKFANPFDLPTVGKSRWLGILICTLFANQIIAASPRFHCHTGFKLEVLMSADRHQDKIIAAR
jgi:hypothetical protein